MVSDQSTRARRGRPSNPPEHLSDVQRWAIGIEIDMRLALSLKRERTLAAVLVLEIGLQRLFGELAEKETDADAARRANALVQASQVSFDSLAKSKIAERLGLKNPQKPRAVQKWHAQESYKAAREAAWLQRLDIERAARRQRVQDGVSRRVDHKQNQRETDLQARRQIAKDGAEINWEPKRRALVDSIAVFPITSGLDHRVYETPEALLLHFLEWSVKTDWPNVYPVDPDSDPGANDKEDK